MTSKSKSDHHLLTSSLLKQCARQQERRSNKNQNAGERFLITTLPGLCNAENHSRKNHPSTNNDDDSGIPDDPTRSDRLPNIDYTHNPDVTAASSNNNHSLLLSTTRRTTTTSSLFFDSSPRHEGQETNEEAAQKAPVIPCFRNMDMELRIMNVIDSALNLLEPPPRPRPRLRRKRKKC